MKVTQAVTQYAACTKTLGHTRCTVHLDPEGKAIGYWQTVVANHQQLHLCIQICSAGAFGQLVVGWVASSSHVEECGFEPGQSIGDCEGSAAIDTSAWTPWSRHTQQDADACSRDLCARCAQHRWAQPRARMLSEWMQWGKAARSGPHSCHDTYLK